MKQLNDKGPKRGCCAGAATQHHPKLGERCGFPKTDSALIMATDSQGCSDKATEGLCSKGEEGMRSRLIVGVKTEAERNSTKDWVLALLRKSQSYLASTSCPRTGTYWNCARLSGINKPHALLQQANLFTSKALD